jgi:hypothetical protein
VPQRVEAPLHEGLEVALPPRIEKSAWAVNGPPDARDTPLPPVMGWRWISEICGIACANGAGQCPATGHATWLWWSELSSVGIHHAAVAHRSQVVPPANRRVVRSACALRERNRSSAGRPPAVHHERRARERCGARAEKERDGVGDLRGLEHPLQRLRSE